MRAAQEKTVDVHSPPAGALMIPVSAHRIPAVALMIPVRVHEIPVSAYSMLTPVGKWADFCSIPVGIV
jgi:hypothetical protein